MITPQHNCNVQADHTGGKESTFLGANAYEAHNLMSLTSKLTEDKTKPGRIFCLEDRLTSQLLLPGMSSVFHLAVSHLVFITRLKKYGTMKNGNQAHSHTLLAFHSHAFPCPNEAVRYCCDVGLQTVVFSNRFGVKPSN